MAILLLMKCDLNNQKLVLVNNSKDTIYYRLLLDTLLLNKDLYVYQLVPSDTVWPNFVMGRGNRAWENKIYTESKDSTLRIFIFNTNKLNDSLFIGHKYKRMNFTVEELDKINWEITIR